MLSFYIKKYRKMNVSYDISQISAEMLLNYFYPELREKWVARYAGTFYRNYNNDHLSVFEESAEVVLARDGFLKLLPEALLSDENELRGGHALEKSQQLEKKKKLFQEAFMPFNTFSFRQKMNMEQKLSEILRNKLDYLLKTFFHYDLAAETNPYIKKIAVLLPYVSKFRADFGSVARMLGLLFGCKTQLKVGRYSCKDSTRYWIPNVEYQLLMPGLSAEEYRKLKEDITPLQQFIAEWMMPAEVRCEITIKHHRQPQMVGEGMILDYNTEFSEN